MSIQKHRAAIDKIDAQIVKLLNRRTKHVLGIGQAKLASGKTPYQPDREQALLRRICKLNDGPISDESLRHIYREVMSSSIALQKTFTIAFLGPEATYTHQAAVRRFGTSLNYAPQKTIAEVFAEVEKNRAEYGVVPVENTTEGVVTHTLDMFVDSPLQIIAQIIMPIEHCLIGKGTVDSVKKLYSHPQAYAQCRNWVRETMPRVEFIGSSSTTAAAAPTPPAAAVVGGRRGRLGGQEQDGRRHFQCVGRREIQPQHSRSRHSGPQRQCHALSGVGPKRQRLHRQRPHQPDVHRQRQGWRPAQRAATLPVAALEHDEDRVTPQQAEGVGIYFLRGCRRSRGRSQGRQGHC